MKRNWKSIAAGLALLIGLSGAAFGADRNDHGRDSGHNNVRVEQRNWNQGRDSYRGGDDDRRAGQRDRDDRDRNRDHDRRVYNYNPYYGNGYYNGYYYGYPYSR
jgi:hypothetical protein